MQSQIVSSTKYFHHGQYSVVFFINKDDHLANQDDEISLDLELLRSDNLAHKIVDAFREVRQELPFWKVRDESVPEGSDMDPWLYPYTVCDQQGSEFREGGIDAYDVTLSTDFGVLSDDNLVLFKDKVMEVAQRVAAENDSVVEFIDLQVYVESRTSETRRFFSA